MFKHEDAERTLNPKVEENSADDDGDPYELLNIEALLQFRVGLTSSFKIGAYNEIPTKFSRSDVKKSAGLAVSLFGMSNFSKTSSRYRKKNLDTSQSSSSIMAKEDADFGFHPFSIDYRMKAIISTLASPAFLFLSATFLEPWGHLNCDTISTTSIEEFPSIRSCKSTFLPA